MSIVMYFKNGMFAKTLRLPLKSLLIFLSILTKQNENCVKWGKIKQLLNNRTINAHSLSKKIKQSPCFLGLEIISLLPENHRVSLQ